MKNQRQRISRSFQPVLSDSLERRDVPARLANFNPVAFLNSKVAPLSKSQPASPVVWTSVEGWSWLEGTWNSKLSSKFFQAIVASFDKKNANMFPIRSSEIFNVVNDTYIGKSTNQAAANSDKLEDGIGIVITPGQNPTLTIISADGSPPKDGTPPNPLKMVKITNNSIVFQGSDKVVTTFTDSNGNTTSEEGKAIPVQVTITRRNPNTFRMTYDSMLNKTWIRIYTYSATKANSKI